MRERKNLEYDSTEPPGRTAPATTAETLRDVVTRAPNLPPGESSFIDELRTAPDAGLAELKPRLARAGRLARLSRDWMGRTVSTAVEANAAIAEGVRASDVRCQSLRHVADEYAAALDYAVQLGALLTQAVALHEHRLSGEVHRRDVRASHAMAGPGCDCPVCSAIECVAKGGEGSER